MHFLGEQFQHHKMLPQRDFAAGGFSLAGVWKAATPGTTAEAQVPRNCWPIPGDHSGELWRHQPRWKILPSQPGSSGGDFLSLAPLWKVLSTHNSSQFSPARGHPWKSLLPIPCRKSCVHPSWWRLCHCRGVSGGKFSRRLSCWVKRNLSFPTGQAGLHKNGRSAVQFIFEECPASTGVAARPCKEKGEKNIEEKPQSQCSGCTAGRVQCALGDAGLLHVLWWEWQFISCVSEHQGQCTPKEAGIITIMIIITKIICTKAGDTKREKGLFSKVVFYRNKTREKKAKPKPAACRK